MSDNYCVDDNQESDETLNHSIADVFESVKTLSTSCVKREDFESQTSLYCQRPEEINHNLNDNNVDFEYSSNLLQLSISMSDSKPNLIVQNTSDGQFKSSIDGCEQGFDCEDTIESHTEEHEMSSEVDINKPESINQKFVCTFDSCHSSFGLKRNLNRHLKSHFINKTDRNQKWSCDQTECLYKTASYKLMQMHQRSHSKGVFVCTSDGCHEKFPNYSLLKRHKTLHNNELSNRYVCPFEGCVCSYTSKGFLSKHIQTEHSNHNVFCTHEECDKKFQTDEELRVHLLRAHTDTRFKTYKSRIARKTYVVCDWPDCGKPFRQQTRSTTTHKRHSQEYSATRMPRAGLSLPNGISK